MLLVNSFSFCVFMLIYTKSKLNQINTTPIIPLFYYNCKQYVFFSTSLTVTLALWKLLYKQMSNTFLSSLDYVTAVLTDSDHVQACVLHLL